MQNKGSFGGFSLKMWGVSRFVCEHCLQVRLGHMLLGQMYKNKGGDGIDKFIDRVGRSG